MIIVSDTSPINNLAAINQLHLLNQLYGTVLIPEAVYRELSDPNFPVAGATEVQTLNSIQTRAVSDRTLILAKQKNSESDLEVDTKPAPGHGWMIMTIETLRSRSHRSQWLMF